MKVTIFCNDPKHPVWPKLAEYCAENGYFLTNLASRLIGGGYLFLISCTQFVGRDVRDRYEKVFVLHESDLPKGRGWSPVAWQILEGRDLITVSLIEAIDEIDAGDIWAQERCWIPGHALADEIMACVFSAKKKLIERAIDGDIKRAPQAGESTYYKRRTREDCELAINRTIADQFDLLRSCEPRFPAYFEIRGHKYELTVRKA